MRIYLALAMALGLSACGDLDLFGDRTETTPVAEQSAPVEPTPAPQEPVSPSAATQPGTPAPSEPPVVSAARSAAPANAAVSAHCSHLAKLRAGDAAFQGEDPDTQEAVYNRTYQDCVAWDAAHGS